MNDAAGLRIASSPQEFDDAARLLIDFNREYEDPVPEHAWLVARLAELTGGERSDAQVCLLGEPAHAVAVLRFRGSLWESRPEAYLAEFYVRPERRGQGIGGRFLDEILERLRAAGFGYVDLNTSESDEAARHVYESRGFDCHEGEGSGPLALYYEKTLGEPVHDPPAAPSRGHH